MLCTPPRKKLDSEFIRTENKLRNGDTKKKEIILSKGLPSHLNILNQTRCKGDFGIMWRCLCKDKVLRLESDMLHTAEEKDMLLWRVSRTLRSIEEKMVLQYFKDKALLMEAKEKRGSVLEAED
ncbi:hypothetical protein Tco_0419065 [Tanacetum coccineum]